MSLKDDLKQALKEIKREEDATKLHSKVHNEIYRKLYDTPEGKVGMCMCGICNKVLKYYGASLQENYGQNAFASL